MEPGKEGGTWLALSVKGKAAIILNLNGESLMDLPRKGRARTERKVRLPKRHGSAAHHQDHPEHGCLGSGC